MKPVAGTKRIVGQGFVRQRLGDPSRHDPPAPRNMVARIPSNGVTDAADETHIVARTWTFPQAEVALRPLMPRHVRYWGRVGRGVRATGEQRRMCDRSIEGPRTKPARPLERNDGSVGPSPAQAVDWAGVEPQRLQLSLDRFPALDGIFAGHGRLQMMEANWPRRAREEGLTDVSPIAVQCLVRPLRCAGMEPE